MEGKIEKLNAKIIDFIKINIKNLIKKIKKDLFLIKYKYKNYSNF